MNVIEADTRCGCIRECDVTELRGRRTVLSLPSVCRRREAKLPPKRPREDLMTGEACSGGNADHRIRACCQPGCGAFEPQPQHVPLRRLTDDRAKAAMEVERRPSRFGRQRLERDVAVGVTHRAKQLQDVLMRGHLERYYLRA